MVKQFGVEEEQLLGSGGGERSSYLTLDRRERGAITLVREVGRRAVMRLWRLGRARSSYLTLGRERSSYLAQWDGRGVVTRP